MPQPNNCNKPIKTNSKTGNKLAELKNRYSRSGLGRLDKGYNSGGELIPKIPTSVMLSTEHKGRLLIHKAVYGHDFSDTVEMALTLYFAECDREK